MTDATPVAMRLAEPVFTFLGKHHLHKEHDNPEQARQRKAWLVSSIAHALDDAGVREAVERLERLIRRHHPGMMDKSYAISEVTLAYAALTGTKEVNDETN